MADNKIITVELLLKEKMGKKLNSLQRGMLTLGRSTDKANARISKISSTLKGLRAEMLAVGLAFLFTGMAISRIFKTLISSTIEFYKKTTAGQTAASIGLAKLSAGWEFLKFTVGSAIAEALLPFIPVIIDVINALSNWIQKNPQLIGGIVIFGAVLGTTMLALGMFILFLNGVSAIILKLVLGFAALKVAAVVSFGLIIAAVALLGAFVVGFFTEMGISFDWFKNIVKVGAIIVLKAFQAMFIGGKLLAVGLKGYFDLIVVAIQTTVMAIISNIETMINQAVAAINKIISAANKVPGVNIGMIGTVDFSGATDALAADRSRRASEASGRASDLLDESARSLFNIDTINVEAGPGFNAEEFMDEIERRSGPAAQIV